MKTAAWAAWVTTVPADPTELQQLMAQLQRQVRQAEDRLANVLIMGGSSQAHRHTLIEIAELNSKLLWLEQPSQHERREERSVGIDAPA